MTEEEKAKRKAATEERKKATKEVIDKEHADIALIMDAMRKILADPAAPPEIALAAAVILNEGFIYHDVVPTEVKSVDLEKFCKEVRKRMAE